MLTNKSRSIDMIDGPLLQNIFLFAVPLMLTQFLAILFNAADTIVVGKFAGDLALAAVGATGALCNLLVSLFNGLSMGTNVVIARLLGSNDEERVHRAVHTSLTIAMVGGILLAITGLFLSKPMLHIMATPEDIIDLSALYMRIYFIGTIPLVIYNFGAAILRSKGDTKRPLFFLAFSGVLNVVLNLIFVIPLQMSVAGVALATAISQTVAAILVCKTLMNESDATNLDLHKLAIDKEIALDILRIGVPAGIQSMVYSLSNVVIQSSINSFDSSVIVAGNSAGGNIEGFVYIGLFGFSNAAITFTSQNVGAKRYERIKKIMLTTMMLVLIFGSILSFGVCYFGEFFLSFYTNEPLVVEVGMIRLLYVAGPLVLNGILDIFVSSMRGMGYSTLPTVLMLLGICGVRLTWIWTVFPLYKTLEMIYVCYPLSWTITSIILGILWYFSHRKTLREASVGC
ncbi:MAG: MATE family efflux transporter [Erysipelotrichaceae bacterium]|nr:MATE family efflux transporter [Erysipelotrichaceae bacterium]